MKTVTLKSVHFGVSKIVAIKALRSATRPTMDLVGARDIVADLMNDGSSHVMQVHDVSPLYGAFNIDVQAETSIPADDVLEFVLDVLSVSDPNKARTIMGLRTYALIREALRAS